MTPEQTAVVERAAQAAAEHVMSETFLRLGINTQDPIEVQKDMASLREMRLLLSKPEFKQDLFWVREARTTLKSARFKGAMAVVSLFAAGTVAGMSEALRTFISTPN